MKFSLLISKRGSKFLNFHAIIGTIKIYKNKNDANLSFFTFLPTINSTRRFTKEYAKIAQLVEQCTRNA